MKGSSERRAAALAAGAVAATLAVVLLVAWAALVGPEAALEGDGPARSSASVTPTETSSLPAADPRGQAERLAEDPRVVVVVAVTLAVVQAAVLLGLVVLLVLALRRAWSRRRLAGPRRAPVARDIEVLPEHERLEEAMRRDTGEQQRLLDVGDAADAIVACWCRFEEQAAAAGVVRDPWETSTEFTVRVLDLADVDHRAVARLAELFREARYSRHRLGEGARAEAREVLARIHGSLRAGR